VDVLIAGAGIGGLALAGGLLARGHRVRVLERMPGLGTGGAAVTIFSNGAAALADLGAPLDGIGGVLDELEFCRADGTTLARADLRIMQRRTGFPVVTVPRSAWLVAKNGQTVRRYSEESAALAMGRPLPVERRHLDALGISGSPEEMHGNEEMDEVFLEFSDTCTTRTVAAEMSVDVVGGLRRSDSLVRGTGMLARIPGTSTTSISPGSYEI
jgi:glycine/D-amino acid oxidase-like deaminating enzyme